MSADDDVRSLRCMLSEKLGLPAPQRLRLKCGSRDLRDRDPVSAIDVTVHAMLRGGLAGGSGAKRARTTPMEESIDETSYFSSDDEESLEKHLRESLERVCRAARPVKKKNHAFA